MIADWLFPAGMGLLSTLHCWGMCGGIVGALALTRSTAPGAPAPLPLALAYNGGRILSYAGIGALAGAGGAVAAWIAPGSWAFRALQTAAFAALVAAGLALAGWLPRARALERAGLGFWRRLQPLGARLLPLDSLPKAVAVGAIWGFLPCGLVYSMVLASAARGSALGGFLGMLAFGLGTLPGMVAAGYAAGRGGAWLRKPAVRGVAGVLVILLALAWYALQMAAGGHGGHLEPAPAAGAPAHHH